MRVTSGESEKDTFTVVLFTKNLMLELNERGKDSKLPSLGDTAPPHLRLMIRKYTLDEMMC